MKRDRLKHILSVFLLTTFVLLKTLSFHVFFHDHACDTDHHCPVCEVSIYFNHVPFVGADNQLHDETLVCYEKHINLFCFYNFILNEKKETSSIVNRPPPFVA